MGVEVEGNNHVLAIREGATENAAVAKELLENLAAPPRRWRSQSLRPSESIGKAYHSRCAWWLLGMCAETVVRR